VDLNEKCAAFVKDIVTSGVDELNAVRKNVFDLLSDLFNEKISTQSRIFNYIAANSIVVEVIDEETKVCFRRELPLRYEETGNGVSLIGEDITGKSSQISFLSEAAYEKIKDLTGKGPSSPRCGGHI